jgi:PAS domain S-box-containing protein
MRAKIRKYIGPPLFAGSDKEDFAAILKALFITLLVISPVVLLVGLLINSPKYVGGVIITDVVVLGALWLLQRGFITVVSGLLPLVLLLLAMYFAFVGYGLNDTALLMFPLVIILAGLLLGRAGVVCFTLATIFYTFAIFYAKASGLITCCNHIVGPDNVVAIMVILATTAIIFDLLSRRLSAALAQTRRNEQALIEANRQLEQQERQYRILYHRSPIMMDSVNSQGQLVSVNEQWLETMGYSAEEVIGRQAIEFLTEESRRYAREVVGPQIRKTGRVQEIAYQFVKKSGEVIDVLLTATAYRDEQGNFSHALAVIRDVTEQKQAEQALRESEAKLRLIYENAYDGISIYEELPNRSRRLIDCNERYAEIAGRSKEELLRVGNTSLLQKKVSPEMTLEEILRVRRENTPYHGLFSWIRPDGKENIIEYSAAPIQVGDRPWTIGLDRDITEHKQITERLRENEARLKTIINQIPCDLWVCDAEGRYILQNAISFDLAGDLIGKTVDDLDIPPEIRLEYKQKHLQALSGHVVREEIKLMVKGQPRILDSVQVPIRNEAPAGERILGFIGMVIDITERKQAELALLRRAEEMTALYETSLEINAELDLSSLLPAIVRRAATLLGVEMGTLILRKPGQETMEIVATHNRPFSDLGVTFKMNEGITGHVAQTGEPLAISDYRHWPGRAAHFANEQIGRALGVPLKQGHQVIGVLNVLDPQPGEFEENDTRLLSLFAAYATITIQTARLLEAEQHHREIAETLVAARTRELEAAQERLIRQEKLAFLGQLAGGVGHELRNPLGVITNAIYFLRMILAETNETVQEYLDLIDNRVQEAEKIVADLLNLSRTKLAAKERVAVSALVAEILRRYPPPAQVTVKADIAQDGPVAVIDPQQIGQVLANLVSNAYQAMPAGGVLTISAHGEAAWVKLSIADTGLGMTSETMGKIFEPLFTTKAKGIGLGLAVSKNLVEVNGGTIEVESVEGQGTTFTLSLPTGWGE